MSIKKNFIYNTIYQILMIIIPIITVPYTSRVLGAEGIGIYSYTNSYVQFFVLFGMLGISSYGARQIAYAKKNKEKMTLEFWSIYNLQFFASVIALILYIIIFIVINEKDRSIYLAQSTVLIATVTDISWFFIGYEDMKSIVVRNSIVKILGVVLVFILVKKPTDVFTYTIIMGGCTLIGQLIMWLNLKGKVVYKKVSFKKYIKYIKYTLVLFVPQLATKIYTLLDRSMLGTMTNMYEVGMYDNSQKTIKLTLTLITSLGIVMLPRMSTLYADRKIKELKKMIYKSYDFINFMALPMVFGFIFIANDFSQWFYGESFDGIQVLLKYGSLLILAIGWGSISGVQIMIPMKMERRYTISVFVGAFVNFILNLVLINKFKAVGTTVASVIAEFTVSIVQIYFLRNFINIKKILISILKPLSSSLIMFIMLTVIKPLFRIGIFYTMIEVIIGILIYTFAMYFLKSSILNEILSLLKKYIKK